jgi:predicted PurR-regulated permease PerM
VRDNWCTAALRSVLERPAGVNDVHPTKKIPEVRLQESPTWPDGLVRGVGSVWGALTIAGTVPFLTFFMLCTKDQMAIPVDGLFGSKIDAARFITNLNQMIRGFVAGNLIVGSVMAVATTLVLWGVGIKGADAELLDGRVRQGSSVTQNSSTVTPIERRLIDAQSDPM